MSLYLVASRNRRRQTGVRHAPAATYDSLVLSFEPNVISYWKFASNGTDQQGVQNATISGNPELNVPTIVDFDTAAEGAPTDGVCIAWPGTIGELAEAAHNAAHKTASGTIFVTHQHDSLNEKSVLVCGDANGAAGGFSLEVESNGSPRAFIRNSGGVPVVLVGSPGQIELNRAYTSFLKWGAPGLSLSVWDDAGNVVFRSPPNSTTDGLAGTSPIRFGAWHTDIVHHDGPYGRVVWMDRRITEQEEAILARAKTITHTGGGGGGGASVSIGTLQPFTRSSINVTGLPGWPAGRLPNQIVSQGARCSAYVRRSWKPSLNSGTHIDFVAGWRNTTATEAIRLRLDNGSEIDLTYQVAHTIPSPSGGGVTRTLDRSGGGNFTTWASAIAALTSGDVLVVRAPTGTWNDSGGHAIPNYVYDVSTNPAPAAGVSNVTIIAHPDDVAAGRRPIIWRNAGRYARFKYAASTAWQVHQDLGSGRVIYQSVATSTQPAHSYFGAYRDQVGDWIAMYTYQAITDAADRSNVMHDVTYTPSDGTAVTVFKGPSVIYNKVTGRWEVRLDGPAATTYINTGSGAPYPPWDWSKHYPANTDARMSEIIITDGSDYGNRNTLLNLIGRNGWKFYNIDFVYGNGAIEATQVTTPPQFFGCTFVGGTPSEFNNNGLNISTTSSAIHTYGTTITPTSDMIFDRCAIHGSMAPWSSFGEGKGFEGVSGLAMRRDFAGWTRQRQVYRYCSLRNWWHFTWLGDGFQGGAGEPLKFHFHHCYLNRFGQDGGLIQPVGANCNYNVNRCFMPSANMYGWTNFQGSSVIRYMSFCVDLRLTTLMCGAPGFVKHAEVEGGSNTSVPCFVHPQSTGHGGGYLSTDRKYHNTHVGTQNTGGVEGFEAFEGCGSGIGPDARGNNNRCFNSIGAVYPIPFNWPAGKSALVGLYCSAGGNNAYDFNILHKSGGMLAPPAGSNTFAKVNGGSGSGTAYASLAALQSGTGFELNSVQADPQFVVTPAWASSNPHAAGGVYQLGNYMLGASSPARTGARNINDQSLPDYDFETLTTLAAGANLPFRGALDHRIPLIEQEVGICGPQPPEIV